MDKQLLANLLHSSMVDSEAFILALEEQGIDLSKDADTNSLIRTFADLFDAVHRIVGSDILYSDVSPLYSDVECPCGSSSLDYWDTTVDEREKIVIQFQCDECNRILNVEYRVVGITEEKSESDGDIEEREIEEENNE